MSTPLPLRPLSIAVVTETWPPEVNGVATTLERLVDGLAARGHEMQLVRPRQGGRDRATRAHELLVRAWPVPGYAGLRMGAPATRRLAAQWGERRPHLVHIATEGPLGWSALRAAAQLGLPVTSDFRTNFDAYSGHYGIGWLRRPITAALRAFHNRTGATMVPTEPQRRALEADGFERVVAVARGVDTERFDPARRSAALRREWGVDDDDGCVVLYVGRLAHEKNLGAFVAAAQAMRRWREAARVVVVGDGPARAALQAALPDAVFAGTRRGADLAAHYASADAFVFPSLTETFGNVVPEAMASGLPVVAYDCAAAGQLVTSGVDGLLAPPGDEARFVAQAVRLASAPEAAQALGQRARATACAHGWERIVAQVEGVFLGALARTGQGIRRDAGEAVAGAPA